MTTISTDSGIGSKIGLCTGMFSGPCIKIACNTARSISGASSFPGATQKDKAVAFLKSGIDKVDFTLPSELQSHQVEDVADAYVVGICYYKNP